MLEPKRLQDGLLAPLEELTLAMRARHLVEFLTIATALVLLGLICLTWTLLALPLLWLLPPAAGLRAGRLGIFIGFRFYVWSIGVLGAYRLDLAALRALRDAPAMVLAPNHPSIIDALLIIAHEPRVACVMKSSLMNNVFLGAGARLARYIRHDSPRRMIHEAVAELRRGGIVLLFPEGTRTVRGPLNGVSRSVGVIARHANVPVQTLLIETDSGFLGKGCPLWARPSLPIGYRMRLGRRFDPPQDPAAFQQELERYYRSELQPGSSSCR